MEISVSNIEEKQYINKKEMYEYLYDIHKSLFGFTTIMIDMDLSQISKDTDKINNVLNLFKLKGIDLKFVNIKHHKKCDLYSAALPTPKYSYHYLILKDVPYEESSDSITVFISKKNFKLLINSIKEIIDVFVIITQEIGYLDCKEFRTKIYQPKYFKLSTNKNKVEVQTMDVNFKEVY